MKNPLRHGKLSKLFPFGDKLLYFGSGVVRAEDQISYMTGRAKLHRNVASATMITGAVLMYIGIMQTSKAATYGGMSIACDDIVRGTYTFKD